MGESAGHPFRGNQWTGGASSGRGSVEGIRSKGDYRAAIQAANNPDAWEYETQTCTRCGGSGKHSFNQIHGDMCYGCKGSGKQATKDARKAMEKIEALKKELGGEKAIEDIRPGDELPVTKGMFGKEGGKVLEVLPAGESRSRRGDVETVHKMLEIKTEYIGRTAPIGTKFRIRLTPEARAKVNAAAVQMKGVRRKG